MKLLKAETHNFGSYEHLKFDFDNRGLTLVYGPTGSGKSTIQDIIPWILFGTTAKNGSADDIRNWSNLSKITKGILDLEIGQSSVTVCRERGKAGQNDLYWIENDLMIRGRDINETQSLLTRRLGLDYYTYTISSYFNEFSPVVSFFTATASERRQLFESIADLDLATILTDRITNVKKETRKTVLEISERFNKTIGKLDTLKSSKTEAERNAKRWAETTKRAIEDLKIKSKRFNEEKQSKIEIALEHEHAFENQRQLQILEYENEKQQKRESFKCEKCQHINNEDQLNKIQEDISSKIIELKQKINPHTEYRKNTQELENTYETQLKQKEDEKDPFLDHINYLIDQTYVTQKLYDQLNALNTELAHKSNSLNQLTKIIEQFRAEMLKIAISRIDYKINYYLEKYFDSELKVKLSLDGDKLEVNLWKSGYECSYKQLSKGQRAILNLSVSATIMEAISDRSGIKSNALFFDEALDGLDTDFKLKAFSLFSELAIRYDSIFVIDHNESLQSLFDNKIQVKMEKDVSIIYE